MTMLTGPTAEFQLDTFTFPISLIFTFTFIQLSPALHATPLYSANMTDLTPTLNTILSAKNASPIPAPATRTPSTEVADEFLKEAHRIVSPLPKPTYKHKKY
jgi:hypothetical protein